MLMYYAFTPDSVFKSVPPNGSELTWQTSMLYSDIAHLIYVNETICTAICPSTRFKSIILLPRMTCLVPKLSQNTSYGSEAWCHFLSLKTFLSLTEEEKGTTEDEMAGWHHWPNWRESEWTLGVGDGQGGLACCDSWDRKELDRTERLIWSDLSDYITSR